MWKPIETAPRDGTTIDCWVQSFFFNADGNKQVAVCFRVPDCSWFDGRWFSSDGNPHPYLADFENVDFTHWMPHPEGPSDRPDPRDAVIKAFERCDAQDWNYLHTLIPMGGRGRFWLEVLGSAQKALAALDAP